MEKCLSLPTEPFHLLLQKSSYTSKGSIHMPNVEKEGHGPKKRRFYGEFKAIASLYCDFFDSLGVLLGPWVIKYKFLVFLSSLFLEWGEECKPQ